MKEYVFYFEDEKEIVKNQPIKGLLKDKSTFEDVRCTFIMSDSESDIPEGDILWLIKKGGWKPTHDKPWRVKILEVEAPEEVKKVEVKKVRTSLGALSPREMIRKMLEEREKKEEEGG